MNKNTLVKLAKAIAANPIVRIAAVRILDVALNKLTKAKKR
jgi:hypothetical protein